MQLILFLAIGLTAGSLMGRVVDRLPMIVQRDLRDHLGKTRLTLWSPGSHCSHCNNVVKRGDTLPLLSWLLLRGRCRYCRGIIPFRYLMFEALCLLASIYSVYQHPTSPVLALAIFLYFWFALALSVIDYRYYLLPDTLTLPLLWLGLLFNLHSGVVTCEDAVTGAAAGYLFLWALYWLVWLLRHKEGLGFGDFKLLAAAGAWTGWQSLPVILLAASLIGVIWGLVLMVKKPHVSPVIPFGPALAASGFGYFYWFIT